MGRRRPEHNGGGGSRPRASGSTAAAVPPTEPSEPGGLLASHELALETGGMASWEHASATGRIRWHGDLPGVLDADPRACRTPDGHPIADLARWLLAPIVSLVEGGAPWECYELERRLLGPDDIERVLSIRARPELDADGQIVGSLGVVANVSAQRHAERALEEQTDRYRLLLELSPDGIVVHENGLIVWANQAAADFVGVDDLNAYLGQSLARFVHPDSLLETLERIAQLTEEHAVSEPAEATIVRLDGTTLVMESVSVRTKWDGRPAYQVILRDLTPRKKAEAALRYQASLVQHVSDAIIGLDAEGRIDSWNPAAEQIYGWSSVSVVGRRLVDVVDGDPRLGVDAIEHMETVHRRADGSLVDVRISVAAVLDPDQNVTGWVAVCADITERRRSEAARRALEERYTAVVASLEEGIIVTDDQGVITAANRAAERILGRRVAIGDPLAIAFGGEQGPTYSDGYRYADEDHPATRTLRTGESFTNVLMGVGVPDSEPRWLSVNSRPLCHAGDLLPHGAVCSFSDVTERRHAESQLSYQATHDALTGLANRAVFVETLRQTLDHARRGHAKVGVLFIDLDRFKVVNDTQGHLIGDEVLVTVARRLQQATRTVDTVARLSGDEFVVLCPDLADTDAALRRAQQIAEVIAAPIPVSSHRQVNVTASVGVSCVDGGGADPEEMLRDADVAMYSAKERGRDRVELLDHALRKRARRRTELEQALRLAIENNELDVHYQPIVSVRADAVTGVEALVRWTGPDGPIPPSEFIPIAEEAGLILPLGTWVLDRACHQAAAWRRDGPAASNLYISVNLSARQLGDPDLVENVAAALDRSGLEPDALWLEITESTLMDDAAGAARTLAAVRALGVHLVIDDFGTGYSSLAYLKRFPVDTLKIDRSFVDGLGADTESEAIVSAVLGLASSLKLSVVAEGVETEEQLTLLRALGCDTYQGFYFARPQPADQVSFDIPRLHAAAALTPTPA